MLNIVYLAESFGLGKPAGNGSEGRLNSGHKQNWPWIPVHSQPGSGRVRVSYLNLSILVNCLAEKKISVRNYLQKKGLEGALGHGRKGSHRSWRWLLMLNP